MTDFSRYARQTQINHIGQSGQTSLHQGNVLIVGMGGLGCNVGAHLAGAGVGTLNLIDHDTIDISNLHRQTLFREADIGQQKAQIAKRELDRLNHDIIIHARTSRLAPDNAKRFCEQADLIIDAADNFAVSYLLSDACQALNKPLLTASVNQTYGYVGVFCQHSPSYRAAFPKLAKQQTSCETVGVTGPSVGAIASIQAQEAIKVLLGKASLMGKLLYLDLWQYQQHIVDVSKAPEPENEKLALITSTDIKNDTLVIDVRNQHEIDSSPQRFKVDHCIDLQAILQAQHHLPNTPIALACHSGQRAMTAGQALLEQGYTTISAILPSAEHSE